MKFNKTCITKICLKMLINYAENATNRIFHTFDVFIQTSQLYFMSFAFSAYIKLITVYQFI